MAVFEPALYIAFFTAVVFMFLFESDKKARIWAGIFSAFAWIILGLAFFIEAATAGSALLTISMFPLGIGILYIVRILIIALQVGQSKRELDDDVDV